MKLPKRKYLFKIGYTLTLLACFSYANLHGIDVFASKNLTKDWHAKGAQHDNNLSHK